MYIWKRDACLAALAGALLGAGCSEEFYRKSADDEVYAVLRAARKKGGEDLSLGEGFRMEQRPLQLASLGRATLTEEFSQVPEPDPKEIERKAQDAAGEAADAAPEPQNLPDLPDLPDLPGQEPPEEKPGEPATPDEPQGPPAAPPGEPLGESQENENLEEETQDERVDERPAQPGEPPTPEEEKEDTGTSERDPETGPETGPETDPETGPEPSSEATPSAEVERIATPEPAIPGAKQVPARILTQEESLRLAFANNRQYQSARESVYLTTLAYTLARFEFAPRFFGIITGNFEHDADGEESGGVSSSFGWTQLFANGARLSVNLLNNFFQFFTGDRREVAQTVVQATLTQPLLRGFGKDIIREPLVQAERDVIYEIRSFKRFRKTFAVQVVSEYLRALETRDRVTNEYNNWRSNVRSRVQVEALSDAGRVDRFELDQAKQSELQAKDRYFIAVQSYESAVDGFKITLGIPIDKSIALDSKELEQLVDKGVRKPETSVRHAIGVAYGTRLDLATERDEVEDARRRVKVVADALRAQFDLTADVSLPSGEGDLQKPFRFNTGNLTYGFGFTLDLPMDRKAERNAYVASIISLEREKRDLSLFEDTIRFTVREAYRALEREIVSYPIQQASVELAEERVTSTRIMQQAGRTQVRDILEAQESLIQARNGLTGSLINYTIARLQFFRDVGALRVSEDGELGELPLELSRND